MNKWRVARIALCGMSFFVAAASPVEEAFEALPYPLLLFLGVVVTVGVPLTSIAIIGIAASATAGITWTHPNWDASFVKPSQPLQFFHAAAWMAIAGGIGRCFSAVFHGLPALAEGGLTLYTAGLLLLAIKRSTSIYAHKFLAADNF